VIFSDKNFLHCHFAHQEPYKYYPSIQPFFLLSDFSDLPPKVRQDLQRNYCKFSWRLQTLVDEGMKAMQSVHLILTVPWFTSLILPRKLLVRQKAVKKSFIVRPTVWIVNGIWVRAPTGPMHLGLKTDPFMNCNNHRFQTSTFFSRNINYVTCILIPVKTQLSLRQ
jgi:hypothetical protein